ncbi:hypothetical protein BB559_004248 [Furculomyces boomerangus]|uniref:DUF410 domain-containing protein n=1 Tax=Furculomyces boomerangus TaxID=61424 RepID=A0A2T9Y100_9FUNG|nr:hypothetical protein BB559_006704 [Furculomyces boomerangus]PVU91208.1 hypothetical protein BB559_004248 [Furculomyces boomerangus]
MASEADKRTTRILNNLIQNISDGKYYEGHQALRTVVNRYVKQKKFKDAIVLLYNGAKELSKSAQWGSVSDLILYLVKIYKEQEIEVNTESKERIHELMIEFPPNDKNIKNIIDNVINWTIDKTKLPGGDAQLHHLFGTILVQGENYHEAERHFLFGTVESSFALGQMLYNWADSCDEADYGLFVSRGVLQYLALGNAEYANNCLKSFLQFYKASGHDVEKKSLESLGGSISLEYAPDCPLINCCQLLVAVVQKSNGDPNSSATRVFSICRRRYSPLFGQNEQIFSRLFDDIAELYFGIMMQKQSNIFADLMGSLFAPTDNKTIEN